MSQKVHRKAPVIIEDRQSVATTEGVFCELWMEALLAGSFLEKRPFEKEMANSFHFFLLQSLQDGREPTLMFQRSAAQSQQWSHQQ